MIRIGITGTDTGIGKTVVTLGILGLLRRRGLNVAAMKPCETGVEPGDPASDAGLLRSGAGGTGALADVCPITLPHALAPWAAARREGMEIDLKTLDTAFDRLRAGRDAIVVEGAGGLLVPITRRVAFDRLFHRWELDLILVAGNRLGVINHTLLTVRAARETGIIIRGIVLNTLGPGRVGTAEETNRDVIADLLPGLPVLVFPWVEDSRNLGKITDAAAAAGLSRLLGERPRR
jgi:dethiobiotin synthetase